MMRKRILSFLLALVTMVSIYALVLPAQAATDQLATPKLSAVSSAATGVTISWDKVSGATKYRVFYKISGGSWTKIADTTSTSYTWTGAASGTKYTFTVRCLSSDGKSYTSAYDATGLSITYIAMPKLTSVSNAATGVTIAWGKVTGAAKYRVFYKTSGGSWTKIDDTTSTSHTWTGAKSDTAYTFTVRCLSSDGKSYTSAYDTAGLSITTPKQAAVKLSAPKLSFISNGASGVTLTWKAVTGAAKYRVYYKPVSGSWTKAGDTTATSYTWTGGQPDTKYTFTVRCVSADGSATESDYDTKGLSITTLTKELKEIYAEGTFLTSYARPMLTQVNNLRTGSDAWYWNEDDTKKLRATGLKKLTYDYALEQIAMQRAAELVLHSSHTRPNESAWYELTYNGFSSWAENIAYGYTSTQSMFDCWAEANEHYEGQGHRRNMLYEGYTSIGIACFQYDGKLYWVQEFGYANSNMPY